MCGKGGHSLEKYKGLMASSNQSLSSSEEEAKQMFSDMIRPLNDNNLYLSQLARNIAYGRTLVYIEREESSKAAENKEHSNSKSTGSLQSRPLIVNFSNQIDSKKQKT